MKSNPLTYLIYISIELIWLAPFLVAAAVLTFSQYENGVEREFGSRLTAANIFLLTGVAARLIAVTFKHNARAALPAFDIVAVVVALILAGALQLSGRLVSEHGLEVGRKLGRLLAVATALMVSIALVAAASPVLEQLKILQGWGSSDGPAKPGSTIDFKVKTDEEWLFKRDRLTGREVADFQGKSGNRWVFSTIDQETRPLTPKEMAKAKKLFARMGPVYVPKKPYKRRVERVARENIPAVLEYPDVVPGDLLPKSDESMVLTRIWRLNKNVVSASIIPHLAIKDGRLDGVITVTALYNTKTAATFFGRELGAKVISVGGQKVAVAAGSGELRAWWTRRRFAFEAQVGWSGKPAGGTVFDFLRHIVQSTSAATSEKVQ